MFYVYRLLNIVNVTKILPILLNWGQRSIQYVLGCSQMK